MESQKIPNCPSNPEENEQNQRHNLPRLQKILQSCSDQNNVLLTQEQAYGSREQNREPKRNPQRRPEWKTEKRQYLHQVLRAGWRATCESAKLENHTHHTQK